MYRKTLTVLVLILLSTLSAAEIQYRGEVYRDKILMNTTVELECNNPCPVSRWRLSWNLPEDAEILRVEDSLGEIEDYEKNGNSLSITTNRGEPRRRETVKIQMRIDREAKKIYRDLHYRRFSIPSFKGEKTTGVFHVEDLISGWIGFGFNTSFRGEEFRFSGEGPTNFRVNFGEGKKTEYYEFFGPKREKSEKAYRLSVGTTGLVQQFEKFPVAVMDDKSFNETVNRWSAGEYTAGTLTLRNDLDENHLPILAHETVHGLNDRFLRWDRTKSSYLDEGVAEYTEYLMKHRLYSQGKTDVGPAELFGEEKKFRVKKQGTTYIYTVPSQGSKEKLWSYYQNDRDFMERWNPQDFPDFRQFGYAYSHLIIRNYVANNNSVRDLYSDLEVSRKIESPGEKWNILSDHLDLTPCKYDSREKFEDCLDNVNKYDYPYYTGIPDRSSEQLQINEIKVPERNRSTDGRRIIVNRTSGDLQNYGFMDFLSGFIDYLISLV
ncbi:MAG: hypothetical protein ABEJ56_00545 [Candidatus Nanohaloarchaea archaeon]